ncbi:VTT domain-containing protein [Pelagibacteraceae bacterium]|nr:VTT domain-containing protein [Pelagibacteraceae bacterium]
MSKNFKLFLGFTYLLLLAVFLYFIFLNVQINRLNDFSYYKELQLGFDNLISSNFLINIIYFFIFAIVWVALLGFGSPILILSGILFGKWIGTIVSIISISIGALTLYSIANFFFSDIVKKILEQKFKKYIQLFQKNEFYYFFLYRFVGGLGVPFFLQNVFPILFNMKKNNYFFSSLFGFVPGFFIFNTIGAGLNTYIKESENFSFVGLVLTPEIYFPILMFAVLIILSLVIKKKFFTDVN